MKTKELIKQLQELDPEGNIDCCVDNQDIYLLGIEPAYYDGCQQILIRDPKNPYYNVISAKVTSKGNKLNISPLSIKSAIWENSDLSIEYDDYSKECYKEMYDLERQKAKETKSKK